MAAILSILCDSFRNGAVDNDRIDSLILMDKPIAQPSAFGEAQSKSHREYPGLSCFDKGVTIILGWRACQLHSKMGIDVDSSVYYGWPLREIVNVTRRGPPGGARKTSQPAGE